MSIKSILSQKLIERLQAEVVGKLIVRLNSGSFMTLNMASKIVLEMASSSLLASFLLASFFSRHVWCKKNAGLIPVITSTTSVCSCSIAWVYDTYSLRSENILNLWVQLVSTSLFTLIICIDLLITFTMRFTFELYYIFHYSLI